MSNRSRFKAPPSSLWDILGLLFGAVCEVFGVLLTASTGAVRALTTCARQRGPDDDRHRR